ncbi:MAG: DUF1882 domain-containing protein [Epsilonproteobacteria bacterium]|nr:DUF1882 domain-containing protein [Campylobacterota bacterium]
MKIQIFDLEFDTEFYYIQRDSIVDKIKFNNRTFYSKFEKIETPPTPMLIKQHLNREFTIALPLINDNHINYIVLEYEKEENNHFYYLLKHLLKSLYITNFYTYESRDNLIQIFIPIKDISIKETYKEIEKIKQILELKSSKRCKILPDENLPKNYNKITLPIKKM